MISKGGLPARSRRGVPPFVMRAFLRENRPADVGLAGGACRSGDRPYARSSRCRATSSANRPFLAISSS